MIDLIKVLASDHFFEVIEYVSEHPGENASSIARSRGIHIVTIQRYLDTLEKYGFVECSDKKGIGRPSKIYSYKGGSFEVHINSLLEEYKLRLRKVRDAGNDEVSFSYDVDKEVINAVLIGGRSGKKIKLDEKSGRFLWMVPPPDSKGETIEKLAKAAGIPVVDAIRLVTEMEQLSVLEVLV
jgi:hypothetical protein